MRAAIARVHYEAKRVDNARVHCPFCTAAGNRVVDSRAVPEAIRRRRACLACGRRFTTFERIEAPIVIVVKSDLRREPFEATKVEAGIRKAFAHREVDDELVAELARTVSGAVYRNASPVTSDLIGRLVLAELRATDEVAYVRFASVYERFEDLDDFERTVGSLQKSAI